MKRPSWHVSTLAFSSFALALVILLMWFAREMRDPVIVMGFCFQLICLSVAWMRVSQWAPVFLLAVSGSLLLWPLSLSGGNGILFSAFGVFYMIHFLALSKKVRFLMRHPEQRWWLIPPRVKKKLDVEVKRLRLQRNHKIKTVNVSENGMLLNVTSWDECENFELGEKLDLRIRLNTVCTVRCMGKVVRKAASKDKTWHYGVEFVSMSSFDRENYLSVTENWHHHGIAA